VHAKRRLVLRMIQKNNASQTRFEQCLR